MVDPIFDYQFRLILIGDSVVGKSSLLKFFTDGKFAEVCPQSTVAHSVQSVTRVAYCDASQQNQNKRR